MKILSLLVACCAIALFTGCTGVMPGTGGSTFGAIYSQVDGAAQHGAPVGETTSMAKVGTAESQGIICVATGDSSVRKAMENGGITKIHHVDYKVTNVFLGLYVKYTTVVYGE